MTTPQQTPERDEFLWKEAQKRVGFKLHLRSFLIVNAGLWLLYLLLNANSLSHLSFTGASFPWPLFATLGWSIGLASHYIRVHTRTNGHDMTEREYQKLLQQR